ncbi:PQQ-dependent sugar dehydrogenase [Terrimonas sp. NA20]|uniref:PQQ-dependent sugar dehydrogenase n=1 Tax=Terrimonas ginsenosidimutans TaxID=2908004 RepID=A0ABS9L0N1_9BACT|nr:PQQ-dependent sugar dehydrogenase [Terrimonas ginsenosidimutans]MCG2618175.1 PQQ-dependent sugar dehydrogenase [Terrimonas ginsenosidimutans]
MITPALRCGFFAITLTTVLFACKKDDDENPTPSEPTELKDSIVARNLHFPWDMAWGEDNHIWITERNGKISRFNPANGEIKTVITIPDVVANGEGGLLGIALQPGSSNVFVAYNYNGEGQYKEKLVKYVYNGTTLTNPVTLRDNIPAANIHNGSRLLIDNGKIFMTTGDANNQSSAQDPNSLSGKVLRFNLDGSIPSDNPVAGNPYWSLGHRNAQGLVLANGRLYSSEHGPSNDDEINIIEKGRNYGWPVVQGYCNTTVEQAVCGTTDIAEPIKAWTPTIAPGGLEYYGNDQIPQWKGSLLLVALKDARLYQLKLGSDQTSITETNEFYNGKYGRMRDVLVAPNGTVYICTSNGNNNDRIIEIKSR